MRTRTKGLNTISETDVMRFSAVPPESGWQPGTIPGWCSQTGDTFLFEESGEIMEDEEYPRPPTKFKPCNHETWDLQWLIPRRGIYEADLAYAGSGNKLTSYEEGRATLFSRNNINPSRSLVPLDTDFSDADKFQLANIWSKLAPSIKSDLDLLVFLTELDDIPKLLKSLKEKAIGLFAKQLPKGKLKVRLSKNLDNLADNWLEYNFALAPLVSDLISIVQSVLNINKRLNNLRKYEGKILKTRGGFSLPPNSITDTILKTSECANRSNCGSKCPYLSSHSSTDPLTRTGEAIVIKPTAKSGTKIALTVMYRYQLPAWVSTFEGKMLGWLSGLGIKPGLDTVWELIPFSFVVDWFFPVGSLLSSYKIDPYPVKTEILDICATRTSAMNCEIWVKSNCKVLPPRLSCRINRVSFRREIGIDLFAGSPAFKWPNWFQLSLGAALGKKLYPKRKGNT